MDNTESSSKTPRTDAPPSTEARGNDFIREIITEDVRAKKWGGQVRTRFPPEPNGYLHIGHAKSICLNFGIALQWKTQCNLRFDDTNPAKEDIEYVNAIQRDVRWLGFEFGEKALYASDYFQQLYDLAVLLIRKGRAYVCSLNEEQIREYRGSLAVPGRDSPYRTRTADENLRLFEGMRRGEFPDGAHVLRAKIDMSASNMKMRDPLLYRVRNVHHDRTGDAWHIYPMYDYAHPLSDSIEGITHSICTLEFENNRELYDWVINATEVPWKPQQIEFARLNLDYTVMSKRKLLQLVQDKHVSGWDDPRMPTIAGMRRRGYTPEAIRAFCDMIGVAKNNSVVDIGKLEFCVRDDMNKRAPRVMCVLRPLKVTLTNYPEGQSEEFEAPYFPPDVGKAGSRRVPFSRELFIEREDFMETPAKDYLRLAPGRVVRLRYGYCIQCEEVVKDGQGNVVELRCKYFPDTLGGVSPGNEKVWGVIHWVSGRHAKPVTVRMYDRLFAVARPDAGDDFLQHINAESLQVLDRCLLEPAAASAEPGTHFQFERQGYFFTDPVESRPGAPVFNRVVGLRDSWAKAVARAEQPAPPAAEHTPRGTKDKKEDTRPARKTAAQARSTARANDPALAARFERYQSEFKLGAEEADLLSADVATAKLFEGAVSSGASAIAAARWLINELPRELGGRPAADVPFDGAALGELLRLLDAGRISGPVAKEVFSEMIRGGAGPAAIVKQRGLESVDDAGQITALIDAVIAENPDKVAQFRAGKTGLLGFFMGQVVKASKGRANPQQVQPQLEKKLKG